MNESKLTLSVYSRSGCHLCDEMLEALRPWQQQYGFSINIIDIDSDAELRDRFTDKIPVLSAKNIDICQFRLDESALEHFLTNTG
ncbi:MAG: glutaredoxin family protein [Proteobacteria bacterium]|nr:glutaredoxin family protein [Pseudomonadota bacterium]